MKILIADDEAISRRLLAAALARLGHEAVPAEDGTQAWALLEQTDAPDLAVLDWNMPGLNGPEICRRLRQRIGARYTYVILLTGQSGSGHLVEGLEAGADDFIAKPFDPAELRARVRVGERLIELQRDNERSRSYLSAVLSHIESAVLLSDASGRVVFANDAFARMAETTVQAAVGRSREEVTRPHQARINPDSIVQVTPGQSDSREQRFDVEVISPERRVVRCVMTPIELPDGVGQLDLYQDITRDADRERNHQRLSMTDTLTGLLNRRGLEDSLNRELSRRRRSGSPMSVALFDIDHFKKVNDTYGHAVGDIVIQAVAKAVAATVRTVDIATRWGGEELLVVLPETDLVGGQALAERVRARVEALVLPPVPQLTISAGVAQLATEETNAEAAIQRADARLYVAKAEGRNAVR